MPFSQPRYAVIRDGEVISRSESFVLARESFFTELRENDFLELTIQNTRAIKQMAELITRQAKELLNA